MKRHHIDVLTQPHTASPHQAVLLETQMGMTTRRVPRALAIVLRLALGAGMAIMLALLIGWVVPPPQDTARSATVAKPALVQAPAPNELEDVVVTPMLFEDFFARF